MICNLISYRIYRKRRHLACSFTQKGMFMRELDYPFDADLLIKRKVKLRKQLLADNGTAFVDKRIAILGGSTTNEIKNMLELFLLNCGIRPSFYESEYNRYYEDGMFDNPLLSEFSPEIIYIHTTSHNIQYWPSPSDTPESIDEKLSSEYSGFADLWDHLAERYKCPIIQNNFELPEYRLLGNQDACMLQGRTNYVTRLNDLVYRYAASHDNFYIHDINYESAAYGLDKWYDPVYWFMYKYAMALNAIPYTSYGVSLIIKSLLGKNKKVLALDLDNTLWGGVIGDDGVENIEIGQETPVAQMYTAFQKYVKDQKQIGTLLTVISKNDEDIARSGFLRPDSWLKTDDFILFKANWEPKDRNLINEADDLGLLPDSFVFVDDNPAEREIVRQSIPNAAVPEITTPEHYIRTLDRSGYFEVTTLSSDDIHRNDMYKANAERKKYKREFTDYRDYLLSLDMKGEILPFSPIYLARIVQLTNKSNQFNLTTRRYTQTEIEQIASSDDHITLYGKLEDRFGDNGVVSVVIGSIKGDSLHIDLWLMSCRVLKRDMEYAMMDELVGACKNKAISSIYGYYYPTPKNSMVKDFYGLQGFDKISEDEDGNSVWRLDISSDRRPKNSVIKVNSIEEE